MINEKERFYNEILNDSDFPSEEIKKLVIEIGEKTNFFELCALFANISLNSKKILGENGIDVYGYFNDKDVEIAVNAVNDFIEKKAIKKTDDFLESIQIMHRLAVMTSDNRQKSGMTTSKEWGTGLLSYGVYYSFCELPDDVWERIRIRIKEQIKES